MQRPGSRGQGGSGSNYRLSTGDATLSTKLFTLLHHIHRPPRFRLSYPQIESPGRVGRVCYKSPYPYIYRDVQRNRNRFLRFGLYLNIGFYFLAGLKCIINQFTAEHSTTLQRVPPNGYSQHFSHHPGRLFRPVAVLVYAKDIIRVANSLPGVQTHCIKTDMLSLLRTVTPFSKLFYNQ